MIWLARFAWRHPAITVVVAAAVTACLWLARPFKDDDPALLWWQSRDPGDDQAGDENTGP